MFRRAYGKQGKATVYRFEGRLLNGIEANKPRKSRIRYRREEKEMPEKHEIINTGRKKP